MTESSPEVSQVSFRLSVCDIPRQARARAQPWGPPQLAHLSCEHCWGMCLAEAAVKAVSRAMQYRVRTAVRTNALCTVCHGHHVVRTRGSWHRGGARGCVSVSGEYAAHYPQVLAALRPGVRLTAPQGLLAWGSGPGPEGQTQPPTGHSPAL